MCSSKRWIPYLHGSVLDRYTLHPYIARSVYCPSHFQFHKSIKTAHFGSSVNVPLAVKLRWENINSVILGSNVFTIMKIDTPIKVSTSKI